MGEKSKKPTHAITMAACAITGQLNVPASRDGPAGRIIPVPHEWQGRKRLACKDEEW